MKQIRYSKTFISYYKRYITRDDLLVAQMQSGVEAFLNNPKNVNDHALRGKFRGYRAFSINATHRIVYKENSDYYIFLKVAPHEEVYK